MNTRTPHANLSQHTGMLPGLRELQLLSRVARAQEPADLKIINARIVNVVTQEEIRGSVAVAGRLIVAVGPAADTIAAREVLDAEGRHVVPGLIDGHLHIESSLVTPAAYADAVVPRGVTAVVWDPHEIANVCGRAGIDWVLSSVQGLPLTVMVTVPSCVPSTRLETSGADISVAEIDELLQQERVVGVAEIMSFPDVIAGTDEALSKVLSAARSRKAADGHAPGISGLDVAAYHGAGVGSDHECTTYEEGLEKLRAGAFLMIREGSTTRDLKALLPLLTPEHADRIGFVTDDRLPEDLLSEGGVDCLVRMAIAAGVEPALAVRAATWNTARYFGLQRRGAVAPGYFADIVVLEDLSSFRAGEVFVAGKRVADKGSVIEPVTAPVVNAQAVRSTVKVKGIKPEALRIPYPESAHEARVIVPIANQILTHERRIQPLHINGEVLPDPSSDIAKIFCVERHGRNGNVAAALVAEFGLRRGALAISVAHDHHNIIGVGISDEDILTAVARLSELEGGLVAVESGQVLAELSLPIAGLLSELSLETVRDKMRELDGAAASLGVTMPAPFMALSFLGLPVIPSLKLTDHGLVDVSAGRIVPVAVEREA
ncbi:MAG: adenine deaminase [Spirochaeta sp.]|nr:adenine deaminase [Spirochaeta sp.]